MSSQHEVNHKSITVKIKKRTTRVNGNAYVNWEIREHTPDGLVRHKRANLQEAREKAKEIREAMAIRRQEFVEMDRHVWGEVLRALEILPPTCLRIDRAAQIVLDSMRYVDADVIVEACRCFKQNNPGRFTPKLGKEVTAAFRDRERRRVSIRRARTESTYGRMTNAQLQTIRRAITLLSSLINEPQECVPVPWQSPIRRFVQEYLPPDPKADISCADAW